QRFAISLRQRTNTFHDFGCFAATRSRALGRMLLQLRRTIASFISQMHSPVKVDSEVAGNGCQPWSEAASIAQSAKPRKGADEHILNQILDLRRLHPAQQYAVHHASVAPVKLAERFRIASL